MQVIDLNEVKQRESRQPTRRIGFIVNRPRVGHEVLENAKAKLTALVQVEVHSDYVASFVCGDGRKFEPAVTRGDCVAGDFRTVRVDEVGVLPVFDTVDERMVSLDGECVPVHVRNFHFVVRQAFDEPRYDITGRTSVIDQFR